ncbi:hypothetical protein BaRGS_00008823, partial [Batillaria attramentaria]
ANSSSARVSTRKGELIRTSNILPTGVVIDSRQPPMAILGYRRVFSITDQLSHRGQPLLPNSPESDGFRNNVCKVPPEGDRNGGGFGLQKLTTGVCALYLDQFDPHNEISMDKRTTCAVCDQGKRLLSC